MHEVLRAAATSRTSVARRTPTSQSIVALAPDLVVLDREENRIEDHDALVAAGISVFVSDVTDVAGAIAVVGDLAGCRGGADRHRPARAVDPSDARPRRSPHGVRADLASAVDDDRSVDVRRIGARVRSESTWWPSVTIAYPDGRPRRGRSCLDPISYSSRASRTSSTIAHLESRRCRSRRDDRPCRRTGSVLVGDQDTCGHGSSGWSTRAPADALTTQPSVSAPGAHIATTQPPNPPPVIRAPNTPRVVVQLRRRRRPSDRSRCRSRRAGWRGSATSARPAADVVRSAQRVGEVADPTVLVDDVAGATPHHGIGDPRDVVDVAVRSGPMSASRASALVRPRSAYAEPTSVRCAM